MDQPDVPGALELCRARGLRADPARTSYFIGRETLIPTPQPADGAGRGARVHVPRRRQPVGHRLLPDPAGAGRGARDPARGLRSLPPRRPSRGPRPSARQFRVIRAFSQPGGACSGADEPLTADQAACHRSPAAPISSTRARSPARPRMSADARSLRVRRRTHPARPCRGYPRPRRRRRCWSACRTPTPTRPTSSASPARSSPRSAR